MPWRLPDLRGCRTLPVPVTSGSHAELACASGDGWERGRGRDPPGRSAAAFWSRTVPADLRRGPAPGHEQQWCGATWSNNSFGMILLLTLA